MFDVPVGAVVSLGAIEDRCSFEAVLAIVTIAAMVGARGIAAVVAII